MSERGMDTDVAKAGCARCQACSGLQSVQALLQIGPRPGSRSPMRSELRLDRAGRRDRARRPCAAGRSRVVCRRARSASERADHFDIRHRVFVEEQAVFAGSDLDAHDRRGLRRSRCWATATGSRRAPSGCSRWIRPPGRWQGDRLAVLSAYRARGVGAPLVRCAVATAGARGGRTDDRPHPTRQRPVLPSAGLGRRGRAGDLRRAPAPAHEHRPARARARALATVRGLEGGISGPGP